MPDPTDLREYGWYWFQDVVNRLIEAFLVALENAYADFGTTFETGTPTPDTLRLNDLGSLFRDPGNAPWHQIHADLVPSSAGDGVVTALALVVLLVAVQGNYLAQIFSSASSYRAHKTRRSAWIGGALILVWYWLAVLGLATVDVFNEGVTEQLVNTGAIEQLGTHIAGIDPESANRAWLLPLLALGAVCLWFVEALLYFRYELLIPIFVYVMPVLIALVYGNLPLVSGLARTIAEKFVSILVLPIPLILLFWGYARVLEFFTPPTSDPFQLTVVVVSLPIAAAYVSWKTLTYEYPRGAQIAAAIAAVGSSLSEAARTPRQERTTVIERVEDRRDPDGPAAPAEPERPTYRRGHAYEDW